MSMYCKFCGTTIMEDDINYCPECKKGDKRTKEINKQLDFVEWMKEKGIYNPIYTDRDMRLMQTVWILAGEGKKEKMWEELKRVIYKDKGNPIVLNVDRIGMQSYVKQLEEKYNES